MSDDCIEIKTPEPEINADQNSNENIFVKEVTMKDGPENESIDELTSIERDLAIMHEVEDDEQPGVLQSGIVEDALAMGIASSSNDVQFDNQVMIVDDESQERSSDKQIERRNGTSNNSEAASDAPDSTTGSPIVTSNKQKDTPLLHDDLLAVLKGTDTEDNRETGGVTIDGEGEFQIVDIVDSEIEFQPEPDPLGKEFIKKEPLTKEEEHKVALEQMQSLARNAGRARENNRRRKQDIKSITQPADLVTSLVSDWSDGDDANADDSDESISPPKKKLVTSALHTSKPAQTKPVAQLSKAAPAKTAQPPKLAVQTKAQQNKAPQTKVQTAKVLPTKPAVKGPQKPVQKPEPSSDKDKAPVGAAAKKVLNTAQSKKVINTEKKPPELPPMSTFKRTRIIKRKIIWDPDAPETQFSYAKLVKPSTPAPAKKEKVVVSPKEDDEGSRAGTPTKRPASTTPSVNGKKKTREIDRLLGDEGAINMLNSLEGERSKRTPDLEMSSSTRPTTARKATTAASSLSPVEKPPAPVKKEVVLPKSRKTKTKASSSWDFVYKQQQKDQDDDSMIVRRRSNSSYSSSASINRLSVDGPSSGGKQVKGQPKSASKTPTGTTLGQTTPETGNQFEFAKPENKSKLKKMKSPVIMVNALSADMKKATAKRNAESSESEDEDEDDEDIKEEKGSNVKVLSIGNVRQVTFNTHQAKLGNTFTVQLMNELSRVLVRLNNDSDCNSVLMLSEGPNFCQGIDFTDLALGTLEKRKHAAVLMAKAVRNFLTTLAKFSKPLIAGVNGSNSGLGVTMLPLFDVIIGSDKGTYETPYAKIGQIPEGYFIFSETTKIRSTFKTKLLWLAEKLHSTESALSGLVNKLTSINKVNEEALNAAKRIGALSSETYSVMKKRSIENILPQIIESLEEEEKILVRQWCSAPCVENFKHFIHKGQW